MWEDEIVNEVRRVREAYAARFDYNLDAIYKDIKKREHLNVHKVVALPVKQDWPADVPQEATTYNANRYKLNGRWYVRHQR